PCLTRSRYGLEVDSHDDPARRRVADFLEPRRLEDATATDVELAPGDVLAGCREHRVALDRARAALSREVDRRTSQCVAHAAPTEADACDEARQRPPGVVRPVLRAAFPRDAHLEQQSREIAARLDGAPAHRLAIEVPDETAGVGHVPVSAVGLRAEPFSEPLAS